MHRNVRLFIVAAALLLSSLAGATTPEDLYVAARDAAIAKLNAALKAEKRSPTDSYSANIGAIDDQARAQLEQQMRAIVGPVGIRGLKEEGTLNLDTLIEGDEGFGVLDGLIYSSADKKTSVIVTTDGLFHRWLVQHNDWWGKDSSDIPQEPAAAIREAAFYTQAVVTDAAIIRFAELPIRKPPGAAFAFAILAARSQSEIPAKADEIFVAAARGGRVFVGQTQRFAPVGPIASCDAIRAEWVKKSVEAAQKPEPDGTMQSNEADRLSAKSEAEFLHCFSAQASRQPIFTAAVSTAQSLIDAILPR
jgi:hypothetical protein